MKTMWIFVISLVALLSTFTACGSEPIEGQKTVEINGVPYEVSGTIYPNDDTIAKLTITPDPLHPVVETTTPPIKEEIPMPTAVVPDVIITAGDLYREYVADPAQADLKYKDKVIQVTGTVTGTDVQSNPKRMWVLLGSVKVELDYEAMYKIPQTDREVTAINIYSRIITGSVGWQFTYIGHCIGFDTHVLLVP